MFETTDTERKIGTYRDLDMDQDIKSPESKLKTIDNEKSKNNEYEGVELKVVEDLKAKIVKAKDYGHPERK